MLYHSSMDIRTDRLDKVKELIFTGTVFQYQTSLRFKPNAYSKNDLACYCFLGLLCEVYRRETGEGVWVPVYETRERTYGYGTGMIHKFDMDGFLHENYAPARVREWYGIEEDTMSQIILANDNRSHNNKLYLSHRVILSELYNKGNEMEAWSLLRKNHHEMQ